MLASYNTHATYQSNMGQPLVTGETHKYTGCIGINVSQCTDDIKQARLFSNISCYCDELVVYYVNEEKLLEI